MTNTLLRQVALVSESRRVTARDLSRVSAALQKQASRDLIQLWAVQATVDPFPRLEDVPIGYWPIIIMDDIHDHGAAGIHEADSNGQPFALVAASDRLDVWSLTTSHELIEMLVDPSGNRLVPADSPKADQRRVQLLVETCGPSEGAQFAYTVNGILVSDFYSIHFFDPIAVQGVRYSFTGAIQAPREVLRDGYLSWVDPATDEWWQEIWFDGDAPMLRNLGLLNSKTASFRSQIDRVTSKNTNQAQSGGLFEARAAGLPVDSAEEPIAARVANLREQINALVGRPWEGPESEKNRRRIAAPGPPAPEALAGIHEFRPAPSVRGLEDF